MPEKIMKLIECSFCGKEFDERFKNTWRICLTYEYVYESNLHSHQDTSQKHPVCVDCNDYWKAMHSLPLSHKDFRQSEYAQEIIQENEDELADFKR